MTERRTPSWKFRTVVQRLTGLAVLVVGLGGFWYWWGHPLPGGVVMRQALLAVLCERRRPPERKRERGMILVLAAMLAFPLGYSLNLALTAPAYPDTGTVLAVQPPKTENDSTTLTIQWRGLELHAILYEDPALLPQTGETADLCVRESPLGIPLVSVCLE